MIKLFSDNQSTKANEKICTIHIIKLDHMDCVYLVIRKEMESAPLSDPVLIGRVMQRSGSWIFLKSAFSKIRC